MNKETPTFNPVAKHAHRFNKDMVHTDRKKQSKRGYTKHKKSDSENTK